MSRQKPQNTKHRLPRYEHSDWRMGPLSLGIGAVFALLVVSLVAVAGVYLWFSSETLDYDRFASPMAKAAAEALPPAPRLQGTPRRDLKLFRENEDHILHSYGWVDRERGVVRIPIDRAMQMTLDRGLPLWPTSTTLVMTDTVQSR